MNFFSMLKNQDQDKTAIIYQNEKYSYKNLIALAEKKALQYSGQDQKIYFIKKTSIIEQLIDFLGIQAADKIPVIVPQEYKIEQTDFSYPEHACFGVMTSGSKGINKLYYRTYESWADFFPEQNRVFYINDQTIIFCNGSLAFTGNLNTYFSVFFAGGTVVAEDNFNFSQWNKILENQNCNSIYLIPSKLLKLSKSSTIPNEKILSIFSGSQSMGKQEIIQLKKTFPNSIVILYYGTSETSFLTYVKDSEMTQDKTLIGKPFRGIKLFIKNSVIFADTPFSVLNVENPFCTKDTGMMDYNGNYYFTGRCDDIININGRKISLALIENTVKSIEGITECRVKFEKNSRRIICCAESTSCTNDEVLSYIKNKLPLYQQPHKILITREIQKNESGKVKNF